MKTVTALKGDKYQHVRDLLDQHKLSGSPKYSGFGIEIYEADEGMRQLRIDWDTNEGTATYTEIVEEKIPSWAK